MEPRGMGVTMEIICKLTVVNRQGGAIEDFSRGSIAVTSMSTNSTPSEEPFIMVRTSPDATGTKYNLIGNIHDLYTEFSNEGQASVCLKEPRYDICIANADPDELTLFLTYLKAFLPKDSPLRVSLAPPTLRINLHLDRQEEYKRRMKIIIDTNTNLDLVSNLKICDCTLELAGDQVPIAGAIKKMKNLTTLQLRHIGLCSSTFLEIESKELKHLHLWHCKTPLPIASLFKNDLCYKDSLVELHLEENRWSEIPDGIFQFQNLFKLSLSGNCITQLPDKFMNLLKLQELELSNNQLTHVPPSIFALQNLSNLSLKYNLITELPNIFNNSSKLQVLHLSNNQLRTLPPSIFALQNLSVLSLNNNFITELPDMFTNLPNLEYLLLANNRLRSVPPSIFALQNLSILYLSNNLITELPDMFTNLPKLQDLSLFNNQLQYLPSSILSLHQKNLNVALNPYNYEIPPSVGSEMVLHSLKELSYRAILNHKLKVKGGMLPKKFLKDLENHHQCVCGCKFVDEGQDLLFFCNLNDILKFNFFIHDPHWRVPVRGKMCNSLKSCFLDRFTKCR